MEVMERRIGDFKTKSEQKGRGASLAPGQAAAAINVKPPARRVAVVHQTIKQMSLDEAIDYIDNTRQDYLLFESDRGGVRLLRRESEDRYTLIEPEIS